MTKRELLKKAYWGRSQIAAFAGCSIPTADETLTKALKRCEDDGFQNLYQRKVFNKYAIAVLGMDLEYMETQGLLDVPTGKK